MYQLTKTKLADGSVIDGVKKVDGQIKFYIPFSKDNSDYQAYLKWLVEGNQPLPADEGTPSA